MSGLEAIIFNPAVVAVVAAAGMGFAAFWANPERAANRAVFSGSLHVACWLASLQLAIRSPDGLFWLKLSCSIGAVLPLHILIMQQALSARLGENVWAWLRRNWAWVLISAGLAIVPFTDVFIPSHSTPEYRLRGWGYYAYILAGTCLYGLLLFDGLRTVRRSSGVQRLELQLWLLGGCIIAVTVLILMALMEVTHNPLFIRLQPVMVLLFYAATAFAITTHRVFDARQIVLIGLEKSLLVAAVAAVAYAVDVLLKRIIPEPFDFVVTTAIALWFAVTLNTWLDRFFHFYPQATTARQAAFTAAQSESRLEKLEAAFQSVLMGWGQSDHAILLSGAKDSLSGNGVTLSENDAIIHGMRQLQWATPERLVRERTSSDRIALQRFMDDQRLGVIVIIEGPALTTLVGVGVPASRRPFTYPQVTQLIELASIIESALERAHFSEKAQHTEQLATVGLLGASLAHEIRNPLVSIKTFVQLLPTHHHDPAFREKFFRLIGDEVSRIDQLTEQLLDLASPRIYSAQFVE
ncbi:MAG: histidine kinase dimerization/phospho-acceptor domain-containing protein, partial [Gemmatimonadota bacterium]